MRCFRTAIILTIATALLSACAHREGQATTLKSGKVIRLLSTGTVGTTFVIEYCSELPLTERTSLGEETDGIVDSFRNEIARAAHSEVSVWPTVCRRRLVWDGWRPTLIVEENTTFDYVPSASGVWTRRN